MQVYSFMNQYFFLLVVLKLVNATPEEEEENSNLHSPSRHSPLPAASSNTSDRETQEESPKETLEKPTNEETASIEPGIDENVCIDEVITRNLSLVHDYIKIYAELVESIKQIEMDGKSFKTNVKVSSATIWTKL